MFGMSMARRVASAVHVADALAQWGAGNKRRLAFGASDKKAFAHAGVRPRRRSVAAKRTTGLHGVAHHLAAEAEQVPWKKGVFVSSACPALAARRWRASRRQPDVWERMFLASRHEFLDYLEANAEDYWQVAARTDGRFKSST